MTPQSLVTKLSVQRIKELLDKTRLYPEQLARLAGVPRSWLRSVMKGETEPAADLLARVRAALGALETALLQRPEETFRSSGVILRHEQLPALFLASPAWLVEWILWAWETGLRPGELAGLRWRDVDLDRRRLRVPRPKNSPVPRWLRLSEVLYAWCLTGPKAQPAERVLRTGRGLARELAAAGQRAGLGAITPMTIRRSVARACTEPMRVYRAAARLMLH